MKILLDLQSCQTASGDRGIGRYSLAHATAVARNAGPHKIEILLNGFDTERHSKVRTAFKGLVDPDAIHVFQAAGPVSELDPANSWRCRAAERTRAHFIRRIDPDVIHVTSHFEGVGDDAPISIESDLSYSVTLYDCIPYLRPELYLPTSHLKQLYYRKVAEFRRAKLWLAISESARLEGIRAFGLPEDRVKTISTAADERFRPIHVTSQHQQIVRSTYGLTRPFVMYTATFEPRKNIEKLIESFSMIQSDVRLNFQLFIVCQATPEIDRVLREQASRHGLRPDELVISAFVSDDDLVLLYNIATLFVFPSLHEGFGLPALEAMQCGTPTIGSGTSSIPEIIGRQDALFNPEEASEISESITRVLTNKQLRCDLAKNGLFRASKFSWDITARRTIEAFEELADETKPTRSWLAPSEHYENFVKEIRDITDKKTQPTATDFINVANSVAINLDYLDTIPSSNNSECRPIWRMEGPFDSTYSLALLNRETARSLMRKNYKVILHNTEGPGDYPPNMEFLSNHSDIQSALTNFQHEMPELATVVSRNLYPPRVTGMRGTVTALHHFAWEESGLPADWVYTFNLHLNKMTALSTHVEKILVDNGVSVDVVTSGCGVDHWQGVRPDANYVLVGKKFRFLHVSSCFPRKGVDVLLSAYGQRFRSRDDVTLIIKTFENPHNTLREQLKVLMEADPDYPDVEIIYGDISDGELRSLYENCSVLVAPSRAEGFGLPIAEAMISGIPAIVTNWGGHLDFCSSDSAWLVDYDFAYSQTHFGLMASVWAEPRVDSLGNAMVAAFTCDDRERNMRAQHGVRRLEIEYNWDMVTNRLEQHCFAPVRPLKRSSIAWVTTWNIRCGIAAYSQHLINSMPLDAVKVLAQSSADILSSDEPFVLRSWPASTECEKGLVETSLAISAHRSDVVLIQFNYGFYNFAALRWFIREQVSQGRIVIVDLHATIDPIDQPSLVLSSLKDELATCNRLLVHGVPDLNRLKRLGLVKNVTLCPLGMLDWPEPSHLSLQSCKPVLVATYGFCLPNKGLIEAVEACALLREGGHDVRLLMNNAEYPAEVSRELADRIREKIQELSLTEFVRFSTDYLDDGESLSLLQKADFVLFPYQHTGESASAAVRTGLASGRPVLTTPLPIFDDLRSAVYRLPGTSPVDIANGLVEVLASFRSGSALSSEWMEAARQWRRQHRYSVIAARLFGMIDGLRRNHGSSTSVHS